MNLKTSYKLQATGELVDAPDSKPGFSNGVQVRFPFGAR